MIARLVVERLAVRRGERLLFTDLSLEMAPGEAVALTGANGAGKTSFLRAIAGFIAPEAGTIMFRGDHSALEPEDARRSDVHLIGHLDGLKGGRTARDELGFQVLWTGGDEAAALALA